MLHSNNGAKHSDDGMLHSNNDAKHSTPPLYIEDQRDQGKEEERKNGAAETPRVDEHSVVPPSHHPTPQKETSLKQKADSVSDPSLDKLMNAIATACRMDLKLSWHQKQIQPIAQELLHAGYTWIHVARHGFWWRNNDWRGKKGDLPRLRELADTLHQSSPYVGESWYSIPDDEELAQYHQEADPDCKFCGGFGWNDSHEQFSGLHGVCICTDPNWRRQQRKVRAY
jgi:hypothetical protein